ncbi:hypothetical protein BGX34_009669 [Mortierella sp. NVP85]|nr:hypothetical protein BGX34_009669 [Mortierella sp. NVP85]
MSKCPDAMKCEEVFSKVFQVEDLPPVDPLLSYIGSIERKTTTSTSISSPGDITGAQGGSALIGTTSTTTTTTVTCKHGPLECAGNTQQLCFKKYFSDYRVWVPFVITMNSWHPVRIGDPNYAREVAERVVKDSDLDNSSVAYQLDKVDECSKGQEGFDLLVESFEHTIHHGVGTSCTVFIDDEKRCVIDGGVWRECPEGSTVADFVRSIKEAALGATRNLMPRRLLRWLSISIDS